MKAITIKGFYIVISLFLLNSCDFFASGSYPFAEYYTFKTYSKESLIKRINIFKENNPEYELPKGGYRDKDTSTGYIVYFYFPDKDITLFCVIKYAANPVRLGFESYSNGTNGGGWLRINKDIKKSESAKLKKKFEIEILNEIGGWSKK